MYLEDIPGRKDASETFIQDILSILINLLLALYLVFLRYLFNMGSAFRLSRGLETLRIDRYMTSVLLTYEYLAAFHRLMKNVDPMATREAHPSLETLSSKCAAGLKTLLVDYLLMQNRHLTGEEKSPKTKKEVKDRNGCMHSVVYVSLISILDGTALSWCKQENLRTHISGTVLFGKVKDPELIVLNFRGQLQCRMGVKREGPFEAYPNFWNLNPLEKNTGEVLRIPTWGKPST